MRDLARFPGRNAEQLQHHRRGALGSIGGELALQPPRDHREDGAPSGRGRGERVVHLEAVPPDADPDVAGEALAEAPAQAAAAREGRPNEEPSPGLVGRGPRDRVTNRGREDLGGVVDRLGELVGRVAEALDGLLHDRLGDGLLGGEMVIEGAESDVGRVGDLLDGRGADALAGHELAGRTDQPAAGLQPPARAASRRGAASGRRGPRLPGAHCGRISHI